MSTFNRCASGHIPRPLSLAFPEERVREKGGLNSSLVMSTDTEVQATDVQMDATVTAVSRSVRTIAGSKVSAAIARCISAISRPIIRCRPTMAGVSVTRIPVSASVTMPVAGMATSVAVPAAVTMSAAVVVVCSVCLTRWNHERQSGSSKGNHQKAFHFCHPELRGKEQRSFYASAVPILETGQKACVFRYSALFRLRKCRQIDTRVSQNWHSRRTEFVIWQRGGSTCSG